MMRRTRSLKISAPPPGIESMPASRSRSSVSRIEMPPRRARYAISTIVKAFRCTWGKRCLRPRSISQYQSSVSSGCRPPTIWNSVTASLQPSPARCHTSSSDMVYALGNSGTGYETPKLSCRQAHLLLVYDHLALWTPLPRTQTSALLLLQLLYESFAGRRTPATRGFPNPLHQGGVFDPLRQCLAPRPAGPTPLPFCHIQNARAVNPAGMRLGTRPPPFRRLRHHAGPHRIALYIPQGLPLVPIVHGAGKETVLPHMAGFTAPQVQHRA